MAINFTLSKKDVENPNESWEGRPWHGWTQEAEPEQLWENNRGIWKFAAAKAEGERIATLSWDGEVVLVAAITGIEHAGPEFQKSGPRRAVRGFVLPEGHPVREALMGHRLPGHRNPVAYYDTSELDPLLTAALRSTTEVDGEQASTGQGRITDARQRKAIEDAAQRRLESHYRDRGWEVQDVRFDGPYDAIARKNGQTRYLEAKGTTSNGAFVTVTAGEVDHARQHPGECVIGILSGLKFNEDGELDETGAEFVLREWNPVEEDLRAMEYQWSASRTTPLLSE